MTNSFELENINLGDKYVVEKPIGHALIELVAPVISFTANSVCFQTNELQSPIAPQTYLLWDLALGKKQPKDFTDDELTNIREEALSERAQAIDWFRIGEEKIRNANGNIHEIYGGESLKNKAKEHLDDTNKVLDLIGWQ